MKKFTKALALVFATCATCMAFGSCGEKPDWMKDVENAITGHKHSYAMTWRIRPDCEHQGLQVYECECGDIYTKKTPTAHQFVAEINETGDEIWVCELCGDEYVLDWWADDFDPYMNAGWWTEEEFTQEVNWYDGY